MGGGLGERRGSDPPGREKELGERERRDRREAGRQERRPGEGRGDAGVAPFWQRVTFAARDERHHGGRRAADDGDRGLAREERQRQSRREERDPAATHDAT